MKKQINTISKNMILLGLATSIALSGGAGSAFAQAAPAHSNPHSYEMQLVQQETKYSKHVMRAVRVSLDVDAKSTKVDSLIEKMPKIEVMDRYLASFGKKVKGPEVRRAVKEIFGIDLDIVSKNDYGSKLAIYPNHIMTSLRTSFNTATDSTVQDARIMELTKNAVMDRYIKEHNYQLTGAESRILINEIFGVNLDGIANLEDKQLAVSSKGQWIIKSDTDLFVLESSLDDVDVSIYTTDYFEEVTGSDQLPDSLKAELTDIGFTYIEESNRMYYKNPTGESVPDAFKRQVMGILIGTILTEYQNQ